MWPKHVNSQLTYNRECKKFSKNFGREHERENNFGHDAFERNTQERRGSPCSSGLRTGSATGRSRFRYRSGYFRQIDKKIHELIHKFYHGIFTNIAAEFRCFDSPTPSWVLHSLRGFWQISPRTFMFQTSSYTVHPELKSIDFYSSRWLG